MERLERCFYVKELETLLSSDPVLKILKPTLIGSLQGPVSEPVETIDPLETIRRLMKLLKEAEFTAGAFDAQTLLECDNDQVTKARRLLFKKLVPLIDTYRPTERAIMPIANSPKDYRTGSSQYASA